MKETVPAAGACVVTALVQKRTDGQRWLYVANAGDSRAVLKCAARLEIAHAAAYDHCPQPRRQCAAPDGVTQARPAVRDRPPQGCTRDSHFSARVAA